MDGLADTDERVLREVHEGGAAPAYREAEVAIPHEGLSLRGTLCIPTPSHDASRDATTDGWSRKTSALTCADAPGIPLAILLHGITANRNTYRFCALAQALAQDGIASLRLDFSGHGQSDGTFEDMTIPGQVAEVASVIGWARGHDLAAEIGDAGDNQALTRLAPDDGTASLPVGRIGLVGHSQGGLVGALFAGQHPQDVDALVLLSAAGCVEDNCASGVCPFPVGQRYLETAAELHTYEVAKGYQGPVCIVHGAQDVLVPPCYAERFHEVYDEADLHIWSDDDHGLMHDFGLTTRIVVDFLGRRLKPGQALEAERQAMREMLAFMAESGQPLNPRIRAQMERLGIDESEL